MPFAFGVTNTGAPTASTNRRTAGGSTCGFRSRPRINTGRLRARFRPPSVRPPRALGGGAASGVSANGRGIFGLSIGLPRDVARQRDVHRSEPRLDRRPPRTPHGGRGVDAVERDRLLGERTEDGVQIELLMRRVRRRRGRHRRRDREERRTIEIGVGDAERQVHRARAERRNADRGLARDLSRRVGHERRHRFVAHEDELDADLSRGLDELQNLSARQAEHPFDTGVAKRSCEYLGACGHDAEIIAG